MKKIEVSNKGITHPMLVVSLALVVAVVGFAGYRVMDSQQQASLNSAQDASGIIMLTPASLKGILPIAEAEQLALQDSNETSQIVDLELGTEDGVLVYKVELSNGISVFINAKTGAVIKQSMDEPVKADDTSEADDALPANFTAGIAVEEALAIAQEKFLNSKVNKIALDFEQGVVVYSIRFADKARVDVDANTGKVVRVKEPKVARREDERRHDDASTKRDEVGSSNQGSSSSSRSSSTSSSSSTDDSDNDDSDDNMSDSGSESAGSGSVSNEVRIEGTLNSTNGAMTITQNGTVYTLQFSQDLGSWTDKKVRAEGVLLSGNILDVDKIELRN